jgi:hypothetical protein
MARHLPEAGLQEAGFCRSKLALCCNKTVSAILPDNHSH